MRQPLVVGNWKMHGTRDFARGLVVEIVRRLAEFPRVEVSVCPPFVWLPTVAEAAAGSRLTVGAQTLSEHAQGAYTGEISAAMLIECGGRQVIVGHSERRQLNGESSAMVAAKAVQARASGLTPIICVGETLAERQSESTERVIAEQLAPILAAPQAATLLAGCVIAYEPVWAIGTGETASPAQAQAVHAFIRRQVAAVDPALAAQLRILYGGSVKPANADELFAKADIDGGLIGGASLQADDFCAICRAAELHG